jgi:protein TonB
MSTRSVLYSPYGAYELKASYQKNFFRSTMIVTGTIVLGIIIAFAISGSGNDNIPVRTIKTIAELGPPPSVAKRPPQVQVQQPDVKLPKVGIPKPVADEEVMDEDVVLATRDEMANITAPDIMSGDGDVVVDIEEDYIPAPDEFVAVEVEPEQINNPPLEYPKMAKSAGLEGVVFVQALVNEKGEVQDVRVAKSSGVTSLDEAALSQARQIKYKPAIQNGRPIKVWVAYKVEFTLGD